MKRRGPQHERILQRNQKHRQVLRIVHWALLQLVRQVQRRAAQRHHTQRIQGFSGHDLIVCTSHRFEIHTETAMADLLRQQEKTRVQYGDRGERGGDHFAHFGKRGGGLFGSGIHPVGIFEAHDKTGHFVQMHGRQGLLPQGVAAGQGMCLHALSGSRGVGDGGSENEGVHGHGACRHADGAVRRVRQGQQGGGRLTRGGAQTQLSAAV
mmetsp:Transcript_19144/g.33088  ORF Transcript_19144/g.33088 Transcript_19144/m.33088 type:complete len:209 (+) Transcript_19144:2329-2955(+)